MKRLVFLFVLAFALALQAGAQNSLDKVIEVFRVFPYQQRSDADAALVTMSGWGKSEWKAAFRLLDDDSLRVKATYALDAYVHAATKDSIKKRQAVELVQRYGPVTRSDYAKMFRESLLYSLADKAKVDGQNSGLPALPGYVPPPAATRTGENQLLDLEDQMALAKNPIEKKRILARAALVPGFSSFILVSKSLKDEEVKKEAALIVTRLALADSSIKGPVAREALETALPLLSGEDSAFLATKLSALLVRMPYDHGFVSLFNGRDLTGWKALVGNPVTRAKMTATELAAAQQAANEKTKGDWVVKDGWLIFTGHGENLATDKKYSDIEMYVDWKITEKGDAGIYLRGSPQVQIWDTSRREVGAQVGSGGLYNNQKNESKPLVVADNAIGQWNRFHIIMKGEKVTVWLNGVLVTDKITLENYWDRNIPIFPQEQIELQAHGTYVAYRNIYLRELATGEAVTLTEDEKKQGFVSLFNGLDLNQWTGNTTGYLVRDGVVEVAPEGGGGNLYTRDEFANFIYRFEFQLTPGANNGIGIHAPPEGDAAYVGMEIQVLDNEAPMYKNLDPRQYHGSVYGIIPAKRGFLLPTGEWNTEEIVVKGGRVKVTLNGTVIVDGDPKAVAAKNGTLDNKEHPGLLRTTGHIGFLGHGDVVRFRNMRVKKL